jgi:hypothetical protein
MELKGTVHVRCSPRFLGLGWITFTPKANRTAPKVHLKRTIAVCSAPQFELVNHTIRIQFCQTNTLDLISMDEWRVVVV